MTDEEVDGDLDMIRAPWPESTVQLPVVVTERFMDDLWRKSKGPTAPFRGWDRLGVEEPWRTLAEMANDNRKLRLR